MRWLVLLLCLVVPACSGRPTSRAGVVYAPVAYSAGDVTLKAEVIRPAGTGPFPPIIVVHGDHGPTPRVRDVATRLADAGFLTLIVDLYRGEKVSTDLEAHILDRALPEARVRGDLEASVKYLATRDDVRPGPLGMLGLDSGGGTALEFALVEPHIKAVVVCYGRLITDAERLEPLRASVLGIFAEKDVGIDDDTRKAFAQAMEKAGKKVAGLHVIAGTEHGFLAPIGDQKEPSDAALDQAWKLIVDYLRKELIRE